MAMSAAHVLVVAGSDSSGGAGIARDIETISAFGVKTCLAVTAVTVQTHEAVSRVDLCAPEMVEAQMLAALSANRVTAIKIGMLGAGETVERVAAILRANADIPVVLDPVIASSSGRALLAEDAIETMREKLMPLCSLVTPNLPELALLTREEEAECEADRHAQAGRMLAGGVRALLVKGGHARGVRAVDTLFRADGPPLHFDGPRLPGAMRGTGCMLASAVAAGLARGDALEASVRTAKTHLSERWLAV
ncbi:MULTISPECIES: hydroxymethylpyrimidine/phosphomethylpyrimidine kinase [Nitratireductor]|uniref:hydroxymethylpyrimidine/phosphomethylpyrimidine kinase n=1 Tax=Nitratireductor TaxID=245876 RepID=UPI001FEF7232|nr:MULTISPECIES: hydroxymethylpyrimidine/phosphomethylpyrimidine kinase [Nitratireductor]